MATESECWQRWVDPSVAGMGHRPGAEYRSAAYEVVRSWHLTDDASRRLRTAINDASQRYLSEKYLADQPTVKGSQARKHYDRVCRTSESLQQLLEAIGPAVVARG